MSIYFEKTYQRSFGTFPLKAQQCQQAIQIAIEVGYRAFDTAQMYGNEADTGNALRNSGINREDLCITTKVPPDNYSRDKFLPSVEQSLEALNTDYVDVLLLHWPPADGQIAAPLELLAQAREKGHAKNIGISNFTAQMMRDTTTIIDAPVVTNQVEFHPLLNQNILLAASAETGIPLASYCSVARGEVFKYPLFTEIGKLHHKTAAQVVQRWILQKGVSVNTMSTKRENLQANFDIADFTLSDEDMSQIDQLNSTGYRIVNKSLVPWAPEFD